MKTPIVVWSVWVVLWTVVLAVLSLLLEGSHGAGSDHSSVVEIAWVEGIVKPFEYINHASIYHLFNYIDIFDPSIYSTITDIQQTLPVVLSVQCAADLRHVYTEGTDTHGFFRYLHVSRIHYSSSTASWEEYDVRSRLGNDLDNILQHSTDSDADVTRVHDRILKLEDEQNAIGLLLSRFEDIRDESFLLSSITIAEEEDIGRTAVLAQKSQCVDTYIAIARHVTELLDYISLHFHSLGDSICRQHDQVEKQRLWQKIAHKNVPQDFHEAIHKQLFELIITMYKDKYLYPFLEDVFCQEYTINAGLRDVKYVGVMNTSYSSDSNAEKTSVLFVADVLLTKNVSWERCTQFVSSIIHVDQELLRKSIDHCETRNRFMFSKANVNEESLLEDLDLINGGGSFSHREIACLVWKESSDAPTCIPFNDAISNYNALNIYSAMFTAADVMNHAQIMHVVDPVATVVPPLITGKALILGLGGGELFTVLSQAFPFLHIDSVDISKEVVINAWKYFGIKYLLCSVAKLSATTGKLEDITEEFRNLDPWTSHESQLMSLHHRLEVLHHKYHQYRDVYKSDFVYNTTSAKQMMDRLQPEDFSCRANVVLSDAWLFIRWKYEHILRQEARIRKYYQERQLPFTSDMYASVDYYDFVFIDVYSDLSTVWNGEKFQGESNSDVDEVITHLDMLQRVLRPFTGVVIFHVHKDKNFQRYYEHVVQKFSARQVTSFEVCANDAIFTVSRERFFRLNDLQTQEQKCNSETTVSGEEITSQCRPSWTEEKRTFDATAEVISPHSPQFRAHIHPCDVEDKSLLAKESAMLGNKLKLNPRYYYSFLASLNCYPFAYDEEESS